MSYVCVTKSSLEQSPVRTYVNNIIHSTASAPNRTRPNPAMSPSQHPEHVYDARRFVRRGRPWGQSRCLKALRAHHVPVVVLSRPRTVGVPMWMSVLSCLALVVFSVY